MYYKKIIVFYSIFCLIIISTTSIITIESKANSLQPTVKINIDPNTIIYEGDIINCTITGDPIYKYWSINNQSKHTTFYGGNPVIYDPEQTPLDTNFVNLTVYTENEFGNASDTVKISIKRIYFGDIHWHSKLSDGKYLLDTMYKNAEEDNYLDFTCSTEHAEFKPSKLKLFFPLLWYRIKDLVRDQYAPGKFTTFLAFEYTGTKINISNIQLPLISDTSHINFYYKEIYPNASRYSSNIKIIYDSIFSAMNKEWNEGHYNIGFFHHPLAGNIHKKIFGTYKIDVNFYINWTKLIKKLDNTNFRENILKVIRGVETYSRWGTAIGKYSGIPIHWQYNQNHIIDSPDSWVENALWEWSENSYTKGHPFVLQAGSDTHFTNRPGSGEISEREIYNNHPNPSGIMAAYAIHNTRDEIWDAMNNCSIYGSQLLKIRANVRFNEQMVLGQWINCSSPVKIQITAFSTFPEYDRSNRSMNPNSYSQDELDYPIQDIWLLKKDRDQGRPWCKIIGHATPNEHLAIVTFNDTDVQPNDFYWVAIRQKGQELLPGQNEYMAFIGPIFINNII